MITRSVGQLLEEHVTLDVEGIDRLYLNAYQPRLQTGAGVAAFFKGHRGARVASTILMAPMSRAFVGEIERFARREEVEVVRFTKRQRKDEVTKERLRGFNEPEGLLYLGIAQERFSTFRVEKRFSPQSGKAFPWLGRSTVMCNQYLSIPKIGARVLETDVSGSFSLVGSRAGALTVGASGTDYAAIARKLREIQTYLKAWVGY